ncbi:esterase [Xaviernesmea oryzae]|uniref:Esterase n=1 Tax=Xaviernesmea oryzae TaxID=464029 RepID=A0A1Q9B2T6_9HYPH|nr:alpha/beta hydrolase [Xaviernesmea oryzae]OLP62303.1 esterase [Xaviernesmea oryzae]SEL96160.1 Esterase/lipase superfamily enzyme [Xaviernesmea oryzae]
MILFLGPERLAAKALTLCMVLSLAVTAGCAGRPQGVLIPEASAATVRSVGASTVDMLVATTRAPSKQPGVLFSGERGQEMRAAEIVVSIPPEKNRQVGQVQWPRKLPANPARDFATVSVTPMDDTAKVRGWIRRTAPRQRRMLVFVHGFNNRYEDAVYRFAQIVHDSRADVAPVIFTWPSRGSIFDYNYDKDSTNYSRDALEELLTTAAKDPAIADITVMAHSMGSWLVAEALRQMAIRNGRVAPKITNVILASPDIDVDVFKKQWDAMGPHKPKFTLFVSRDDRALALSRRIAGNVERLGQIDPLQEPYRSGLEQAGITVLDLTALKGGDPLNHGKFAESPEVVKLLGNRLIAGQTITDSEVGIGERVGAVALGTAQTVGSAASVAVSTPILIFDPRTRANYGEQLDRLNQSLGNTVGAATLQ